MVLRWWRRCGGAPPVADVVVLAVSDPAIRDAAATVLGEYEESGPILIHCAGGLPPEAPFLGLLPTPRGMGLLHPLRALAGAAEDVELGGTVFGVSGDALGLAAACELGRAVGGEVLQLSGGSLARYHAAAVLVSNHAVGLVDAGVSLLVSIGLDSKRATEALSALLLSTARNVGALGLAAGLTGPIARGDVEAVRRHLDALSGRPDVLSLYRASALPLLAVAARKPGVSKEALLELAALLSPGV